MVVAVLTAAATSAFTAGVESPAPSFCVRSFGERSRNVTRTLLKA
jgi:hypothetical protein